MSYIEHDTPLAETWDITYFYNPVTETGKLWVLLYSHSSNQSFIKEFNIINSNFLLSSISRTIQISEYITGRCLEYFDSNNLITTRRETWQMYSQDLNFVLININNEGDVSVTPEILNNLPIQITSTWGDPFGDIIKTNYNTIIYPKKDYVSFTGEINTLWEINMENGESTYIGYSELVNSTDIITSLFQYDSCLYAITQGGYGSNYSKIFKYSSSSGNTNIWSIVYDTLEFSKVKGSSSNPYCTTGTTNILQSN